MRTKCPQNIRKAPAKCTKNGGQNVALDVQLAISELPQCLPAAFPMHSHVVRVAFSVHPGCIFCAFGCIKTRQMRSRCAQDAPLCAGSASFLHGRRLFAVPLNARHDVHGPFVRVSQDGHLHPGHGEWRSAATQCGAIMESSTRSWCYETGDSRRTANPKRYDHRYLHDSDSRQGCVLVLVLSAQASRLFLDIAVHHSIGILPSVFRQLGQRQEFEIGGCGVGD